jgi:hypothetical protein
MDETVTAVFRACADGDVGTLRALVSLPNLASKLPRGGAYTLMTQVQRDLLFEERYLATGLSAAQIACFHDRTEVLDLILSLSDLCRAALVAADGPAQWTLLHHSANRGCTFCVVWLSRVFPDLCMAKDLRGRTPLCLLLTPLRGTSKFSPPWPGSTEPKSVIDRPERADPEIIPEIAMALLAASAPSQLEEPDADGRTPLLLAIHHRRPRAVLLLLDEGADFHARESPEKESAGETVRRLARMSWHGETRDEGLEFVVARIVAIVEGRAPSRSVESAQGWTEEGLAAAVQASMAFEESDSDYTVGSHGECLQGIF